MKNIKDIVNDLEAISKGKIKLNESAVHETVKYITKMKEAFGDMEDSEMPKDEVTAVDHKEENKEENKEEKTMEERVAELEAKVAELEEKFAEPKV